MNIEAEKQLSVFIAKALSGLPYEKSNISRTNGNYSSANLAKRFHLQTEFEIKESISQKTALDHWLTERYCLYLEHGQKTFRYDIHHKEWNVKTVELLKLDLNDNIGDLTLTTQPDLTHYSDGVKVIAWGKTIIYL